MVNRIRFFRIPTRPERIRSDILGTNAGDGRLTDAERTTRIATEDEYLIRASSWNVPPVTPDRRAGFRYTWESGKLCTVDADDYRAVVETSPSPERLRRLQTLLLPLVQPKDLPFDLVRSTRP